MIPSTPRISVSTWAIAAMMTIVASIAIQQAATWYAHPFAGVLVTPQAIVSSIGMPSWSGIEQGLRFPDRMLQVDGFPVVAREG
ncbi:MAG: sensor histidine kinase, partial [Polyangiaceae bacterium]